MKYTKELALQVAKTHNIAETTLRVWATRGDIPKKYFDHNGDIVPPFGEKITDADKYRLTAVLELNEINWSETKAISTQKRIDFLRGQAVIYKSDYIALKRELTNLKNKATPVFAAKTYEAKVRALRAFFKHPAIKPFTFAEKNREHQYCIEQLTTGKTDPDMELVEQTIINIGLFFQSIIL